MKAQSPEERVDPRGESRTENESASRRLPSWNEIFTILDKAQIPDEFLADRRQGVAEDRSKP